MIRRPPRSPLSPSTPLSQPQPPRREPAGDLRSVRSGKIALHPLGRPVRKHPLGPLRRVHPRLVEEDRKSTRLNSSHQIISYAVFCLKKKNKQTTKTH